MKSDRATEGRDETRTGATVVEESLESLHQLWARTRSGLAWDCLFVLPPWLRAWQATLGRATTPLILSFRRAGELLGVASLRTDDGVAAFLGSPDVCDYQDFVGIPGREGEFLEPLLIHLGRAGVRRLDLGALRPDSLVRRTLPSVAEKMGWALHWEPAGVSVELDLPETWDAFLGGLGKRERHEVRRKFRRLEEAGGGTLRRVGPKVPLEPAIEAFFALLSGYRDDKAAFLTPTHRTFFRSLIRNAAQAGVLDLSFLDVGGEVAAATLCFEYRGVTYLYNNGYHSHFADLSVGFLSKLRSIRSALERGNSRYDLLKGDEPYKLRLGGRTVPLWRCLATIE